MADADAEKYSTVPEVYRWCQMEEDLAEMHGRSATLSLPGFSTSSHHLLYSGYLGHRSGSPDSYSPTAPEPRDFKCEGLVCQWHPRSFLRMPKPCDVQTSAICAYIYRSTYIQVNSTQQVVRPRGRFSKGDFLDHHHSGTQSPSTCKNTVYGQASQAPSRSSASVWLNRNSPYHYQSTILHRVPCRYSTVSERGRSPKTLLGHS